MKLVLYVVAGFAVMLLAVTLVALVHDPPTGLALFALWVLFAIPTFGAFWMMYMAVRYEREPVSLILLAIFIPFTFVWYYFERVRPRKVHPVRNSHSGKDDGDGSARADFSYIKTVLLFVIGTVMYAVAFWVIFTPGVSSRFPILVPLAAAVFFIHPIGAWWLIYRVVRHEKRVFPFILLSCVPLGFVWYYFDRVRVVSYNPQRLA